MDAVAASMGGHRLNVLLNDPQQDWAVHLPRLLEPQGIRAYPVATVDEALRVIGERPIHAAFVDLGLPAREREGASRRGDHETGGLKLLEVIRRLRPSPPTVVVRDRRFDSRTDNRILRVALSHEAFSVLDQPVNLEQLLRVLRRLIERHYAGMWPGN